MRQRLAADHDAADRRRNGERQRRGLDDGSRCTALGACGIGASPAGIDIDRVVGEGGTEALADALAGQSAAHGSGLSNPEIARIARRSGVTAMTTNPILPALLVALEN